MAYSTKNLIETSMIIAMAIDILRPHHRTQAEAWKIANDLVKDLADHFGVDYNIEGDHLHFERPGVSGSVEVTDSHIRVTGQLNFFLAYMEPKIESEIQRYLDDHFT